MVCSGRVGYAHLLQTRDVTIDFVQWFMSAFITAVGFPFNSGRAFTHSAVCHRIDPTLWTHRDISRSSQCSMTGLRKAMACDILSVE